MSTLKATNIQNAASALTSITLDTSGGLAFPQLTGLTKANGSSSLTAAARGTDYSLITSGTSVASTSGTSIDFTGIPAGVKRIMVILNGVSTSGASLLLAQIGSGSVSTSGYLGNAGVASSAGNTVTAITAGIGLENGTTTATSNRYILLTLTNMTGNSWVGACTGSVSQTTQYNVWSSGAITLGGALDRVRITTTNGTDTFDAGSINILYEF